MPTKYADFFLIIFAFVYEINTINAKQVASEPTTLTTIIENCNPMPSLRQILH